MSLPVHIADGLARHERGEHDDHEHVQFLADVLIAGLPLAMPSDVMRDITEGLMDGTLSEHGDVLRWPGEGEGVYSTEPRE